MGYAAPITTGHKPCNIRQDTTSNGDDRFISAIDRKGIQFAQDMQITIHRFVLLPRWKDQYLCVDFMKVEVFSHCLREILINICIHDDKSACVFLFACG